MISGIRAQTPQASGGVWPILLGMTETHVVSALRAKRAELGGEVRKIERTLHRLKVMLQSIDNTIRVFQPDLDPATIEPKRPRHRSGLFKQGELPRLGALCPTLFNCYVLAANIAALTQSLKKRRLSRRRQPKRGGAEEADRRHGLQLRPRHARRNSRRSDQSYEDTSFHHSITSSARARIDGEMVNYRDISAELPLRAA